MKKCTKCLIEKPYSEFWKEAQNKDGLKYHCISCSKIGKTRSVIYRQQAIINLGNKCVRCGFSDIRALQIDHIEGGGSKKRKETHNLVIYRRIAKGDLEGYQVLCANCNWIKRSEQNENGDYYGTI